MFDTPEEPEQDNRVEAIIERTRRQLERTAARSNMPIISLQEITQRLDRRASDRLRNLLEERNQQTVRDTQRHNLARVDKQFLRRHFTESVLDKVEEKDMTSVRAITESIGILGSL